jgi:hypothetical protein
VIFTRRIVNYFKWTKLSIIGRISSVSFWQFYLWFWMPI